MGEGATRCMREGRGRERGGRAWTSRCRPEQDGQREGRTVLFMVPLFSESLLSLSLCSCLSAEADWAEGWRDGVVHAGGACVPGRRRRVGGEEVDKVVVVDEDVVVGMVGEPSLVSLCGCRGGGRRGCGWCWAMR